ncbi:DUF4226 domain-containing protein [Mycobacteroides abscessus]|uniref:DUF4226 domain-containing protein n=1 Tax=Mycobacteroides abscessus TaxID=36809 RepID=UPI0009A7F387|nr:DUF4226 domain-containing protein [Mycobacteroides abscessus]SKO13395.1 Biofilm regulator BssS [Mycobacteroides abscessus subsp. bolletii]SKX39586.1 Biofilm regulator BssS [Mycobacteroides abscessus subsp. bolletii]
MGWESFGTIVGGILGNVAMPGAGALLGGAVGNGLGRYVDGQDRPAKEVDSDDGSGKSGGTISHDRLKRLAESDGPDQGKAADAAKDKSAQLAKAVDRLAQLDEKSRATLKAIEDEGEAGRKALDSIQSDLDTKMKQLGPRMDTAQGQQEFRDYALEKLTAAKEVIAKQNELAAQKAREAIELTKEYSEIGGPDDTGKKPEGGAGSSGGDGGGSSGGGSAGSGPEGATTPAAATNPLAPGQGMPMGMGGMPFGGGFPGMGGGVPGMGGGGIPGLGDLGGLGAGSGAPKLEDAALTDHDGKGHDGNNGPQFTDPDKPRDGDTKPGEPKPGDPTAHPGGATTPAGDHGAPVTPAAAHTGPNLSVSLPDGTTSTARTEVGREVVTSMMANGSNVADEYAKKGVVLMPPGTPVEEPVSPSMLKAGDVGMWKDHYVTALGDNKVWVSGQVQSLESLGSSPDFLGWFDPTAKSGGAPSAPGVPPVVPDPTAK